VRAVQVSLVDAGTAPRLSARGKETARVANPVSMNSTTAVIVIRIIIEAL
jgi:hypothetical protein